MSGDCGVWIADTAMYRPELHTLLDAREADRVDRLARRDDRVRSALGAALMRHAVAHRLGIEPGAVVIDRRCQRCGEQHGKPQVLGAAVGVSVSHSAGMVAVAVSSAGPVGIDVEQRGASAPDEPGEVDLAPHVLAAGERLGRAEDLLTYWCRKESVVKATGEGLQVPLEEVVVSPPDSPARLVRYRGVRLAASMFDLDVAPAYVGAVTVLTDRAVRLGVRSAAALLAPHDQVAGR